MKIFIQNRDTAMSLQTKKILKDVLEKKGHEIITNEVFAERVFIELSKNSNPPMKVDKKNIYYKSVNGRPVVLVEEKAEAGKTKFIKECNTKNITCMHSKEDISELTKGLIDYILGIRETIEMLDPFPFESLKELIDLTLNSKRKSREAADIVSTLRNRFSIDEVGVKIISEEIGKIAKLDNSSKFIYLISKSEYVYSNSFGKGILIPNISYSLISNLVKAYQNLDFSRISNDDGKKKYYLEKAIKEIDELKKTLRNSLFNKNSWKLYSKKEGRGIYNLFIPDNSLKDTEVLIPKPSFSNVKKNVSGQEVAILHSSKVIIATSLSKELKRLKNVLGYRVKIVDNVDETLKNLKLYPSIGDEINVTRHPITTLIVTVKVAGYTDDGSIRVNNKIIQILEGDSDGDSLSVSWDTNIKFSSEDQLNEYIKVAKINLDFDEKSRTVIKEIDNSTKAINEEKLNKSAIEQATAKLVTANLTGSFGVSERTIILSYIMDKRSIDLETVFTRSRISQLSVQAKNILSELQNGNLSKESIDTFKTYYLSMEDKQEALIVLSTFLNIEAEEVAELLFDEKVEIIEEKENMFELF